MPPRASLKTFLATARAALTAPRSTPLTFVVGNESADLDSLCSALLLAYFHTYAPRTPQLHIPICHLHRPDLTLRPEFAAVLRAADVRSDDMFTLEDVLRPSLHAEDTRWVLVDHNTMTGALAAKFASRVIGCVDHHVDEGGVPADAEMRVIETSGSCASLVVERCKGIWDELGKEEGSAKVDEGLAHLALASILIDTSNLKDANKTTAFDERAVAFVEGKINGNARRGIVNGDGGYERTAFYDRISKLKEDLSEMSLRDVLRKDYKEWEGLGTSSSPRGFGYLVREKSGDDAAVFGSALSAWAEERDGEVKLDLMVVLTAFVDAEGKFQRELLIWARSETGVKAAKSFEEKYATALGLEAWEGGRLDLSGEMGWRRCWSQGALKFSRKQVAPMLREALKEVSGAERNKL